MTVVEAASLGSNEGSKNLNARPAGGMDLESIDAYLKRTTADIEKSKAQTARRLAAVLVISVALSLPLFVAALLMAGKADAASLQSVFNKWYDIMSPLVGTAIGAMFGLAIARQPEGRP